MSSLTPKVIQVTVNRPAALNISISTDGTAYRPTRDAIITTETAGTALEGLRAVVFDGQDKVVYASASNHNHAGKVAGLTLAPAAEGQPVQVVRHGIVYGQAAPAPWDDSGLWDDSGVWNDYGDQPAFLGENGLLTNESPAPGGFIQQLVYWQSSTSFMFSPSEQVIYIDA